MEITEKRIAVLPFKMLSSDPETEYLAEGLADVIRAQLGQVRDLRVLLDSLD